MSRNRAYKRTSVKQVDLEALRDRAIALGGAGSVVGLDVAKDEIVACVRFSQGELERPWSVRNPDEIVEFLELLTMLKSVCDSLTVGIESTGTYGEALRMALTAAGIEVHRVGGKAVDDYRETFDGVPSSHDGKDAAIVAELTAFGKGTPWPHQCDSESVSRMKHQVMRLDTYRKQQVEWIGRLEALLAQHWPELTKLLSLSSVTLLQMLAHYHSPARLAADAENAERLAHWGGPKLTEMKIERVIESARATRGVLLNAAEGAWLSEVAANALSALRAVQDADRQLRKMMAQEESYRRYVPDVGAATLAVICTRIGDPREYSSGGALLKAMGLNLKERSSGRRKGELSITKRGPSAVRRWLYYWALRAVQRDEVKEWYRQFTRVGRSTSGRNGEHRKMKALVALMRKLVRGLRYAMIHDEDFDYGKLFEPRPAPPRRRRQRTRNRHADIYGN